MKIKLQKNEYTTLFQIASTIATPEESKVTAAGLIEKIRQSVQGHQSEPEELTIELELWELANLCVAFQELVKREETTPLDVLTLKALARSLRIGNKFESMVKDIAKTENTIELDPVVDLELDPE